MLQAGTRTITAEYVASQGATPVSVNAVVTVTTSTIAWVTGHPAPTTQHHSAIESFDLKQSGVGQIGFAKPEALLSVLIEEGWESFFWDKPIDLPFSKGLGLGLGLNTSNLTLGG
jgi:hypothetical protein